MLCLGATLELIAVIALGLVALFCVFMLGVFVYSVIILMGAKRCMGVFTRSETDEKSKIPFAYYMIDDAEYKNMFPLEVIFQKKIYSKEKMVRLMFNEKKKVCFDNNAVACCILGIIVSLFLVSEMVFLFLGTL